ncbi:hypothetical protein GWK47_029971 [Chionoecetes opilio]|uniref:Uncharacterized protein n=1 Tax=Chionoecetes opilio TaxID=41210 RepID=A0A8J4YLW6_CHIOP|nr:hypothetical protein GWK47_029971 [Chionoecetes opilio]
MGEYRPLSRARWQVTCQPRRVERGEQRFVPGRPGMSQHGVCHAVRPCSCVAPFFPRRRQFLASEEVVRHVRFPPRLPDSLDAVLSKLLLEVACARRKLGAGPSAGEHADEPPASGVWVWVGGWSGRGGTGSRPDIPPQLAEGGVLVERGAPLQPLGLPARETPVERGDTTSCNSRRLVGLGCRLYSFLCRLTRWLCSLILVVEPPVGGVWRRPGEHLGMAASAAL